MGRSLVERVAGVSAWIVLVSITGAALAGAQPSPGQSARASEQAEQRARRQQAAAERALFSSDEPISVTLIADFAAVNRDRDPKSTKTFPATLVVNDAEGKERRVAVNIRTRGHARRLVSTCTFAPLRLEFPQKADGSPFAGHKSLKLGTHCRDVDSYEQYVYREYLAYKALNQLTERSFRVRLTKATYVDAASRKQLAARAGLFLEDDDDVARRLDGTTSALQGMSFSHVDLPTMTRLALFEYMIGNTDMSLAKLHNIILVRASNGAVYPVPYDFDYSGLVNARYAVPEKGFELTTVRERLYRGPCLTVDQLKPEVTHFLGARDAVLSVIDHTPGLSDGYRKDARAYLDQFFRALTKPDEIRHAFIDGCKRSGM